MGKIEIDHTGSGGGITLSSDGTNLLLGGTAVGGGADLYAANESSPSAQPSATGANAISIGDNAVASNTQNIAIGHDSEASTGTYNFAFGSGATANASYYAVAIGSDAGGNGSTAGGNGSFATSGGVTAGNQAQALGKAYASGTDSFAAAIANNTSSYGATGSYAVAMGIQARAYSTKSIAIGGSTQVGNQAVALGDGNTATSSQSTAIGYANSSVANNAFSFGSHAKSGIKGKLAYAGGNFSTTGDAQNGTFVLRADTTDATAESLTTDNSTPAYSNQISLLNHSAYAFHGTIVARESGANGTECAAWRIEGLIRRENGQASTVLVNSATTVIDNTYNWGMALSANTSTGSLKIEVTGAASTNIRWVATIHTSEVTYA